MAMLVHLMLPQRFLKTVHFYFLFLFICLISFSDFYYSVFQFANLFLCIIQSTVGFF